MALFHIVEVVKEIYIGPWKEWKPVRTDADSEIKTWSQGASADYS